MNISKKSNITKQTKTKLLLILTNNFNLGKNISTKTNEHYHIQNLSSTIINIIEVEIYIKYLHLSP